MPATGSFLGEGLSFPFCPSPFSSVTMSFYFYDPLLISHFFNETCELKTSGLHFSPPPTLKLKAGSLELVVLRRTSPDPRNESASPRTSDSCSYQETLIRTPSQCRIPYFPHDMFPGNTAALRVCVSIPEPQSLMHTLISVRPAPPDVSPVFKVPYLSILNPCLVCSSGKVSGHCKNPKNIPYSQPLFLKEILKFPSESF